MQEIFILLLLGFGAGALSGLLGVGGGIIVIPGLTLLLGFTQHQAQGTSLALLLPPLGILAAYNYFKADFVDIRAAMIMAAMFIIGSYITSSFAVDISTDGMKKIFAVFMLVYSVKLLLE